MKTIKGTAINNLVTMGPIRIIDKTASIPQKMDIKDSDAELVLFENALDDAKNQLATLYDQILKTKGDDAADIIEVQQMMLEDEEYLDEIKDIISDEKICAAYAVYSVGQTYSHMFAEMDNEYMQARAADILDVSSRLVNTLLGKETDISFTNEKVILVADDLGPSETVKLDKEYVLAFVTVHGSTNSHTAILARAMGIPALVMVDVDLETLSAGTMAVVDGTSGEFILDPDEQTKAVAKDKMQDQEKDKEALSAYKGLPTETKSGQRIKLFANIGSVEEVQNVIDEDGEGIGLFRSEFLYIGRDSAPNEEEQYEAYKAVLEKMGDKPVIIRTLDIGADKQADYLGLPKEENPALGLRAIRICLTDRDLFKTQIKALLRAACFGNLYVMYPMIISEVEIDEIKEVVGECEEELKAAGNEYKIPHQGIMIETPAAVMMSEQLAKKVDFFSIGTNDLTQYTLAIDRQNQSLDKFYDSHHPAVLAMIKMVIDNSHKAGIWTGICGELGADISLTKTFLEMGVDELSVSTGAILKIRQTVREM